MTLDIFLWNIVSEVLDGRNSSKVQITQKTDKVDIDYMWILIF